MSDVLTFYGPRDCRTRCLNYAGMEEDLDSVLTVLIRRINGEADLESAAEWVRANHPRRANEILTRPVEDEP